MKRNYQTIALWGVALLVPVTLLVAQIAEFAFKSANPNNVDITASLAYLGQGVIAGIAAFAVVLATIIVAVVLDKRATGTWQGVKQPIMLFVAIVIVISGVLLFNKLTSNAEDDYLRAHNRPTLDEFFDAIKKNEQQK
jgi:hypothetical protein